MKQIFFIHIMKTAGTSFRKMLVDSLGGDVYPSNKELYENKNRWYLDNHELTQRVSNGSLNLINTKVVCGHYPFVLARSILPNPRYATFLREPVARSMSMINHRKKALQLPENTTIHNILDDRIFVERQIENYQTKIFTTNTLKEKSVNLASPPSSDVFDLACERMFSMDFVGITEKFQESVMLFNRIFDLKLGKCLKKNTMQYPPPTVDEISRIEELVELDSQLYNLAVNKMNADMLRF